MKRRIGRQDLQWKDSRRRYTMVAGPREDDVTKGAEWKKKVSAVTVTP